MKLLDDVRVINDNYQKSGVVKNMIGTIIDADIRWNSFYVCFQDQRANDPAFMKDEQNVYKLSEDICLDIKIKDLELVKDNNASDEQIKNNLPKQHADFWCKVENGYIINLKGKRKNKTPYDYES